MLNHLLIVKLWIEFLWINRLLQTVTCNESVILSTRKKLAQNLTIRRNRRDRDDERQLRYIFSTGIKKRKKINQHFMPSFILFFAEFFSWIRTDI